MMVGLRIEGPAGRQLRQLDVQAPAGNVEPKQHPAGARLFRSRGGHPVLSRPRAAQVRCPAGKPQRSQLAGHVSHRLHVVPG